MNKQTIKEDFSFTNDKANDLLNFIETITNKNSFYKNKYKNIKVNKQKLTFKKFTELPLLKKEELIFDQSTNHPFGSNAYKKKNQYIYLTSTSGTSGNKFLIPYSKKDLQRAYKIETKWMKNIGVGKGDKIIFILPFNLYPFVVNAALNLGATVIPPDYLCYKELLEKLEFFKVDIIETSPTIIFNLQEEAEKLKIDVSKIGIKKIILTGELGGSVNSIRKLVKEKWGADVCDAIGSSENLVFTNENKFGSFLSKEDFIFEVIDNKTGKHSNKGELVITNLWRKDFPLIRYKTGDLVELKIHNDSNEYYLKQGIMGRIDGTLRIHGQSVFPLDLEKVIRKYPEINRFKIYLKKENQTDHLIVLAECDPALSVKIESQLYKKFREIVDCKIKIIFLPKGRISMSNYKSRNVIDERNSNKKGDPDHALFKKIYLYKTVYYFAKMIFYIKIKLKPFISFFHQINLQK